MPEAGAGNTTAIAFARLASVNFGFSPCFDNGEKLSCTGSGADSATGRLSWHAELAEGPALGKLKSVEELFAGRHFDSEVIILCVRWYLRFKLSLRDLAEMIRARLVDGAYIDHALGAAICPGV